MSIKRTLFLICIYSFQLFSQNQIKGKITDSLSTKPLEYAIVSIFKSGEQKLINGKLTDSTGTFVFSDITDGNYFIKIDLIGYKSSFLRDISVDKSKTIDLGNVVVSASTATLHEIEVSGQQDPNQNKIDKQTYRADQFQSAKGGTALDVLRNTPSVNITAEGDIRLRGSTGFLILINGKPVLSDAKTVLNQIPANAIENIEIITAPTSKYDADGKSGIINITLKRGTDDGLSFSVNSQYGLPSVDLYNNKEKPQRYGGDFTINYKRKKWDLSTGASYLRNDNTGLRDGDVNTTIGNQYTTFPSIGERSFQRQNYSARASVTYTADKSNAFNAGFYIGQRQQFRLADITYNTSRFDLNSGASISNDRYFNDNLVKKQGNFSLANLDYTHTFQNKSNIAISGLYEYAYLDGFTKNIDYPHTNSSFQINNILNTGKSPINGLRGKIDHTIQIGKGKLESGYQLRYQNQTGEYLYINQIINAVPLNQIVPEFSANINIYNLIHGLYSQYTGKVGKLDYIAGLRFEYSKRTFNSDKLSQPYELDLSNLFPSLNLMYSFKNDLKAKAGFSRRVQRSTNNELNPYPEREHAETLEQGDPKILPEFVNLSELGLIKEFKIGSVFVTAYNQYIQNVVNRVNSVYTDTILNRIYTNAGNATLWGLEAGINLKPVKWWTIYAGGNLYDYLINGSLFNNAVTVNNSGVVYSFNTNHNFQILKTLSLQFNMNYLSQRPTAQGQDSRFWSPNLSIKKTFFNGALSAMIQWQNIGLGFTHANEQRITTWGSNFYTTTNYIQEKDIFWVNLGYNFKQTGKKLKLPNSEFGEKEF